MLEIAKRLAEELWRLIFTGSAAFRAGSMEGQGVSRHAALQVIRSRTPYNMSLESPKIAERFQSKPLFNSCQASTNETFRIIDQISMICLLGVITSLLRYVFDGRRTDPSFVVTTIDLD